MVGTGAGKKTFHVHEGLLKHYSSYLRSAMKKAWMVNTKIITLSDDSPADFKTCFFTGRTVANCTFQLMATVKSRSPTAIYVPSMSSETSVALQNSAMQPLTCCSGSSPPGGLTQALVYTTLTTTQRQIRNYAASSLTWPWMRTPSRT
jgi:hypothetical protein